jgi:hypothetical protein
MARWCGSVSRRAACLSPLGRRRRAEGASDEDQVFEPPAVMRRAQCDPGVVRHARCSTTSDSRQRRFSPQR